MRTIPHALTFHGKDGRFNFQSKAIFESVIIKPQCSRMSNRKLAKRKIAVGLGIICVLLIAGFGAVLVSYGASNAQSGNGSNPWKLTLEDLQNAVHDMSAIIDQMRSDLFGLQNSMQNLTGTVNELKSNLTDLQVTGSSPVYRSINLGVFNISSGLTYHFDIPDINHPVFCGGFSTLSVYYYIEDVSEGNFTLRVSLGSVDWYDGPPGLGGQYGGPMTSEPIDSLNITIVRDSMGYSSAYTQPVLIQTKAPYFGLGFRTSTNSPNWQDIWVQIRVFAYLRN